MQDLITSLRTIVEQASDAILEIYHQDFSVYTKDDQSPLTQADLEAHKIITKGLQTISDYPILSEEGKDISWEERSQWSRYWLVDPIDGTKEFIKKNGEFTVNIALIEEGTPVLGIVGAPALDKVYIGSKDNGAWIESTHQQAVKLMVNPPPKKHWRVVGSRSHNSEATQALADSLPESSFVAMGSSLKLCAIAEGKADLYPRLGLTSEWDTAAAQAIVEAAGGQVVTLDLKPLRYNQKESLLNPYFIVCSQIDSRWSDFALKQNISV